ncbi:MAG TPA: hypothetical protein PLB32_06095, partial [Acidobacteriota bacterium]|nr:hypothetical protein [Acidobacteriota bacterium]
MSVRGDLVLNSGNGDTSFHYCGFAGRLQEDATTSQLKRSLGWPKVVKRTQGYNQASLPVKGDPHFATLISSHPAKKQGSKGSLELRWCVFFPVGKQPQEGPSVPLETFDHHITINLHGFFFLDSERLRIDGLEDRFKLNEPRGNEVCINWNEFVATQGSLQWLPQSLTDFALHKRLNSKQCRELADALKKTWLWQGFQEAICSENTWQPCWRAGIETWSHISTQNPPLIIPHTDEPEKILKSIPVLGDLSLQHSLVMLEDRGSV